MARNEVQRCMDWLFQQQGSMEEKELGRGQEAVKEAVSAQKKTANDIRNFRSNIDKVLVSEKLTEESRKELDANFNNVSNMSKKKQQCLETVSQIAVMEDFVQGLSNEFDKRAHHLVNVGETSRQQNGPTASQSNESMARASQACVQAVRSNWQWLSQVMQCAQLHMNNAAGYHQFFHEVQEAEYWMENTLSRIHLSFDRSKLEGNRTDALIIQRETRDVLAAFLQWQTKVDYLFDRAKVVVPVPHRTTTLKEEKTVIALTDFSNSEISFIEGEALYLVDNGDRMRWKVRNNSGETGMVPAVIVLIPAPFGPATDAAIRLRIQLLSLWTASVKRLGYQLIAFMLLVFKDWNAQEVTLLQQLSKADKAELLRVLKYLDSTLKQHWHEYGNFQELQDRIHRLQMIIEEAHEGRTSDSEFLQTVVVQIKTLEDLLKKYQDFWSYWETYKTIVELIKQPEFLLVCDKWDQLRYITTAHFVRFWDIGLVDDIGSSKEETTHAVSTITLQEKFWDTNLDLAEGEIQKETSSLAMHEAPPVEISDQVTIAEEHEDTTTETVSTSVVEEQHTFIITGVLDPRDNMSKLDLQTAIMLGVVDQAKGLYINPLTGATMTMQDAMNMGYVLMEFVSKEKIREEKQSYGLITIKTTRETRPYTVTGVVDPVTEKTLTISEASQKGIVDSDNSYRTETGEKISLQDAISSGLVLVEYQDGGETNSQPEVVIKTYAVHGVVDQQKKKKISFNDAVSQGLLDRDTGEYVNNVTQDKMAVQDAIMKGFIKARVVTDLSKLEVDPRNQIVVEKLNNVKQKLKRGVNAAKMFQSAGK